MHMKPWIPWSVLDHGSRFRGIMLRQSARIPTSHTEILTGKRTKNTPFRKRSMLSWVWIACALCGCLTGNGEDAKKNPFGTESDFKVGTKWNYLITETWEYGSTFRMSVAHKTRFRGIEIISAAKVHDTAIYITRITDTLHRVDSLFSHSLFVRDSVEVRVNLADSIQAYSDTALFYPSLGDGHTQNPSGFIRCPDPVVTQVSVGGKATDLYTCNTFEYLKGIGAYRFVGGVGTNANRIDILSLLRSYNGEPVRAIGEGL
ncbi:MAG TPA: hypothetical protein VJ385_14875 [Fibrobacteria bacterium]|nr:hypothetical protein [Fibrobacteria bacterium]